MIYMTLEAIGYAIELIDLLSKNKTLNNDEGHALERRARQAGRIEDYAYALQYVAHCSLYKQTPEIKIVEGYDGNL